MNKYIYIFILLFSSLLNISFASDDTWSFIVNKSENLSLELLADRAQNVILTGDEVTFFLSSSEKCNVILLRLTANGDLIVLFPNKSHRNFQISAGVKYQIPGFNMKHIEINHSGTERLKAIGTVQDGFFDSFSELQNENDDFVKILNYENFLKKLQSELEKIPRNKWAVSELEFAIKDSSDNTQTGDKPYVNKEIQNIVKNNHAAEYYMQGHAYYEEGKYDKAIAEFKKFLEISKNNPYGYYALGLCYQAKGVFKEAIGYYKKCLNQGVKERDCYVRAGEIYDQSGDKKESYGRYKKALSITEGYEDIKDMEKADTGARRIYDLEMKCRKNEKDKESHKELAVIYEKLGVFKTGNYHLKMLLKQAIPLYEPCNMEDDKPENPENLRKIIEASDAEREYRNYCSQQVYNRPAVEPDYYNSYNPCPEPYKPPPPDYMTLR